MNFCETLESLFILIGQVWVDLSHLQLMMLDRPAYQIKAIV